jgi:hypothetical protein
MVMRKAWAVVGLMAVLAPACRRREVLPPPPDAEIPREIAVQKLRDFLPKADEAVCRQPGDTLKQDEIAAWTVGNDGLEIARKKGEPLRLAYKEIRRSVLERSGRYYYVKLFTAYSETREHWSFIWKDEEAAKRVAELFENLRPK